MAVPKIQPLVLFVIQPQTYFLWAVPHRWLLQRFSATIFELTLTHLSLVVKAAACSVSPFLRGFDLATFKLSEHYTNLPPIEIGLYRSSLMHAAAIREDLFTLSQQHKNISRYTYCVNCRNTWIEDCPAQSTICNEEGRYIIPILHGRSITIRIYFGYVTEYFYTHKSS